MSAMLIQNVSPPPGVWAENPAIAGDDGTPPIPDRAELFIQAFHTVSNLGIPFGDTAKTLVIERSMERFEVAAYTPGKYARPALRMGAELWQVLAWRRNCEPGATKLGLTEFARELVDCVNHNTFSQTAVDMWPGVFERPASHGEAAPWTPEAASAMRESLKSAFAPVNQGVDASTLGTRALAGVVAAMLWDDPPLKAAEGPDTEGGARPLPGLSGDIRTLKSLAATATSLTYIEPLIDCRAMSDVRGYLDTSFALFKHDEAALTSNGTPMAGRLSDTARLADHHDARSVGEALQAPPEAPDFHLFTLD